MTAREWNATPEEKARRAAEVWALRFASLGCELADYPLAAAPELAGTERLAALLTLLRCRQASRLLLIGGTAGTDDQERRRLLRLFESDPAAD